MSEEERLHIITEQLLIVRDNLFRGMSKSMQKLQARSINEVLELPNFTESPQHTFVGLDNDDLVWIYSNSDTMGQAIENTEAKLKEKNT